MKPIHSNVHNFDETRRALADLWQQSSDAIDTFTSEIDAITGEISTISDWMLNAYGQLELRGDAAQNVTASDAKVTVLTDPGPFHGDVNIASQSIVVGRRGDYLISLYGGFLDAGTQMNIYLTPWKNGASMAVRTGVYVPAAAQVVNFGMAEIVSLGEGDALELYIYGSGVTTVTMRNARFSLTRLN